MSESHGHPGRIDIELPIQFKTDVGDVGTARTATATNISTGGVFVATQHVAKLGDRLALNLTVPGWPRPIAVAGEVRWIRTTASPDAPERLVGMGLQFVGLTPVALLVIQEFIQAREEHEYANALPKRGL
jgi:uncharacterized protein (TIGR02266 family)